MTAWFAFSILTIFSIIETTLALLYQIQSTKAVSESLTDKLLVNCSVSKLKGLTLYVDLREELNELYTEVSLVVDVNDKNEYDFDVVKRTINTCRLFRDPTYEPVIQFLYKNFLSNGHFPTECPIQKDVYFIKDMKTDAKSLPQMMADKKAILSVKHFTKENDKMKLLASYGVHFAVVRVYGTNDTVDSMNSRARPKRPNRPRAP